MGTITETGIIIKQTDYNQGKRWLSIFTENYGIIRTAVYGTKRRINNSAAGSQFLCYGEFELYISNRDYASFNNVNVKEAFIPISEDITKLSLCTYMSDIVYAVIGFNNPDKRLLKVFLNTLYALAYLDYPISQIKSVFELKLMSIGGYMPNLDSCSCGSGNCLGFDFEKGSIVCQNCAGKKTMLLNPELYKAIKYIIRSDDKKMLSFRCNDALLDQLSIFSETYLLTHTEKTFSSLDYYKLMIKNFNES